MAKKSGSPKKQAAGKARVKKSDSRKPEASQAKAESARSRTGSRQAKGTSQSSGKSSPLKALKSGGCILPTISFFMMLIMLGVSFF